MTMERRDTSDIHQHLASDIDLEETDQDGWSVLFHAVNNNNLPFVDCLLEKGANPNKTDHAGRTPLLVSVAVNSLEIVQSLIKSGADLEKRDSEHWTGLLAACYLGHTPLVRALLSAGVSIKPPGGGQCSGLAWGAGRGHLDTVRTLLQHGAGVDSGDRYGTSPLTWAVRGGHADIVKELLAAGARTDTVGMYAWSPLIMAARTNQEEIVNLLLCHSPNLNIVDKDGLTPLAIACKEGNLNIVHQLILSGAHVNLQDRAGDTNLVLASKNGHANIVDLLLRRHADLDTRGKENKTALYNAVEKNHVEVVRLLLSSGADIEAVATDGNSPLLRAVKNRNPEIVSLLMERKVKLSGSDKKGDTALHVAMRAGSRSIVELILRNPKHSQLLYKPNQKGETPYNIDMSNNKPILSQLLGTRQLNTNEDSEGLLGYDLYGSSLANILAEPSLSLPITVGLYAKWGSGKSLLLKKLQKEMTNFSKDWPEPSFTFSPFLFIVLLHLTGFIGLACWLTSHLLKFEGTLLLTGLVMAGSLVSSYTLLFLFTTSLSCEFSSVRGIKSSISNLLNKLELLSKILFCKPPGRDWRSSQDSAAPVRHFFTDQTKVSTSAGGEDTVIQMVGTLLDSVELTHGKFATRLFRAAGATPDTSSSSLTFRTFVGLPLVILYIVTFAFGWLEATLIILTIEDSMNDNDKTHSDEAKQSSEKIVHIMLIFCSSVLGLILMTRLPNFLLLVKTMFASQRSHLSRATDDNDLVKSEGILQAVRNELDFLVQMVDALDGFTNRSSRMTIIVDGLDIIEQRKVLNVLDTVHYLFSDPGHPFIILIAIDPHIIIKAIELNINEAFADTSVGGYSYLRNVVHLPFFLQYTGTRRIKVAQALAAKTKDLHSVDSEARFRSQAKLMTESSENVLGKVESATRLAGPLELQRMFLTDDYFSDVNPRSMRRLMNVVYVMRRLLKAFKIDFNWHHLSVWVNVTEQWPYRASWLVLTIEQMEEQADTDTPLALLYQTIKHRIPEKVDTSFNDMDRDENKLEIFLKIHKKILTVKTVMIFFPFTINLDPYLRKIIQDYINHRVVMGNIRRQDGLGGPSGWIKMKDHQRQTQIGELKVVPASYRERKLSSMAVTEVCHLLKEIAGLSSPGRASCKEAIIKENINGSVLHHCDINELKEVLKINFGDWEILRQVILGMRKYCLSVQSGSLAQEDSSYSMDINNSSNINKNSSVLEQMVLERQAVSGLVSNINEDARDDVEMGGTEGELPGMKTGGREIGKIYYSSSRSLAEGSKSRSIPKLFNEEAEVSTNDDFLMIRKHSRRQQRSDPPEFDEQEEIANTNTARFYLDVED